MSGNEGDEKNEQPRAKIELTGSPDQVASVLKKDQGNGNGASVSEDEFFRLLTTPASDIQIYVDRIGPKEFKGRMISGWLEEYLPPTSIDDIQNSVRGTWGGGRYKIRILRNGKLIAARQLEIGGNPKLPADEEEKQSNPMAQFGGGTYQGQMGMGPYRPPALITDINRDPDVVAKRKEIEILKLERELKKLSNDGASQTSDDKVEKVLRELNDKHEREMTELRRQLEQRQQDDKLERMQAGFMAQIKSLEEKLASPEQRGGGALKDLRTDFEQRMTKLQSELSESVKALRDTKERDKFEEFKRHIDDMRRDFDAKLTSATSHRGSGMGELKEYATILGSVLSTSTQGNRDMLNQMFQIFSQKMSDSGEPKSETGRFAEFLEVLAMAQDVMGGREGPEEPAEPKDFGTAFLEVVREAIPSITDALKNKNGNVSREEIEKIIQHNMNAASKNVARKLQSKPAGLPSRAGQPRGLEDTVESASPDPAAERRLRVTNMFRAIAKELPVRPRVTRWLDYAFDELPDEVLDAVVQCTTPQMFVDVCRPDVDPNVMAFVTQQLADQTKLKWFADTLAILRNEYAKMQTEGQQEAGASTQTTASHIPVPAQPPPDQTMTNPNV